MKTIEQKAKRYDETLKAAVVAHKDEDRHLKAALERIFPELKESDDERIRKTLIEMFSNIGKKDWRDIPTEKIIAWLEKQGDNNNSIYDKELSELLHVVICRYVNDPDISYIERDNVSKKIFPYVELLEKQDEQKSTTIDIDKMVSKYANTREDCTNGLPVNCQIRAYRQGLIDALKSALSPEKQSEELTLKKVTMAFLETLSETPYNNMPIVQAQASAKQLLAFLTNPKSYNPDSDVEPKFHEGDWVVYECGDETATLQITRIAGKTYVFSDNSTLGVVDEDTLRLWDIAKDAKDGDVLCYEDEISIYKHDIKNCTKQETTFGGFVYYCCYDGKRFITDSLYSLTEQDKTDIHPATKEQRDLLFQKIKEAGYEWNAENYILGR